MLPVNPIWPLLDNRIGHISVNAWPIFITLVSITRFSRVGSPSVRSICCDNIQSFNEITHDLIKYKPFSLQINVIRQHLTTTA